MGDPNLNCLDMLALMAIDRAWTVAFPDIIVRRALPRYDTLILFDMISLSLTALDYVSTRCML